MKHSFDNTSVFIFYDINTQEENVFRYCQYNRVFMLSLFHHYDFHLGIRQTLTNFFILTLISALFCEIEKYNIKIYII